MSEDTVEKPVNRELYLAACAMARPDYLRQLGVNPERLSNPTARAVFKVLQEQGPAMASPGPMLLALEDLPEVLSEPEVHLVFQIIPEPDSVELGPLLTLKASVEKEAAERQLAARIQKAAKAALIPNNSGEIVTELRRVIEEYSSGTDSRKQTATSILTRSKEKPPVVRYRVGVPDLDEAFRGIDRDGNPASGMAGKGHIIMLAGGYKRGKTREALNWVVALLNQGCSVALLVLEDDEGAFSTKLMATAFDIPPWQMERYVFGLGRVEQGKMTEEELPGFVFGGYIGSDARYRWERFEQAVKWFEDLGDRLRVYDGESGGRLNIFDYDDAIELLTIDKALYDTDFVMVDYVQAWSGDYEDGKRYAFGLRAWAGRNKVGVIALSQMSNETIKWGSQDGVLSAKGNGEWGAICHVGIEIETDPSAGDAEFALNMKVARNAPRRRAYVQYSLETGKALKYYGTPEYLPLPGSDSGAGKKGKQR